MRRVKIFEGVKRGLFIKSPLLRVFPLAFLFVSFFFAPTPAKKKRVWSLTDAMNRVPFCKVTLRQGGGIWNAPDDKARSRLLLCEKGNRGAVDEEAAGKASFHYVRPNTKRLPPGGSWRQRRLREHARLWRFCEVGKFIQLSHPSLVGGIQNKN